MATVVDKAFSHFDGIGVTLDIDFTATVQSGDVVVLILHGHNRTAVPWDLPTGLGATWSSVQRFDDGSSSAIPTTQVYKGQATTDGTITLTWSSTWRGSYYAVLMRDVDFTVTASSTSGQSTTATGPTQSAGSGQVVLAHGAEYNSGTLTFDYFDSLTPASGWTSETLASGSFSAANAAYRVPTSTADHQVATTGTLSNRWRVTQVVVGTAAAGAPEGTGSGAFSWSGVAEGIRDYEGSGSGSFAWAGAAVGSTSPKGSGAGAFAWSGSAVGAVPPEVPSGSGSGSFAWAGSAVGAVDLSGSGAGAFSWTGTAVGSSLSGPSGTGSGSFSWTGTAEGAAPGVYEDTRPLRSHGEIGYLFIPPAADPPNGTDPIPVQRVSHIAPAITEANPILTEGVDYPLATRESVGTLHIFIGGVDCTYLGGAPVIAKQWKRRRPIASTVAAFEVPAMQKWHRAGVGDYAAITPDAPVELALIDEDGNRTHLWSGFVSEDAATVGEDKVRGFTADGTLWQASYTLHEPPHYLPPTDIGVLVARALNGVPNRRWSDVPEFTTGIMSRFRGSSNMSVTEYVLELLARAWTDTGQQWTLDEIAPGEFRGLLKPDSGFDWTITAGVHNVDVSLSRDESTRVDVIYGKGTEPNGGQWRGTRFPGLILATPPPYPINSAASMHLGDTDADTDSGTGISDWQRRMVELGYSLTVDGVLNSSDIEVVRRLQARMGLLVDGVIGPQTWAGSFNRGPEGIDLTQWREPIAAKPWTQEFLRDPNGVILGDNPEHDPTRVIHAIEVNAGTDITWSQAQPLMERMLEVEGTPALTGTIRLLGSDPHEGWAGLIREGDRIKVLGWQGEDPIVTVAAIDVDETDDGLQFVFTVDERSRDALSVEAILERNRDALPDLARKPGNPARESRLARDRYVQWDIDSPCGFMPRTAVFGGLWVAPNPIPMAEVGRVVKAMLTSTVPFTLALFGLPVKPSQMVSIVGNPHTQQDPWVGEARVDALDRLGWIISWGAEGERCGFTPNGQESAGATFTGRWEDHGGFDFVSGHPPYVWPLLFSSETGFIGGADGDYGRFYPGTWI